MILIPAPSTPVHTQGEETGILSRTLLSPGGGKREKASVLIPQETGYLLLLGAGPSPQMGTPPSNPLGSGRSAPSPVCRFMPAKLSTALLWAGLMKRRKLRTVSHHEWPLERWLGPHGTLFFLSGVHGGPTVSRPWDCSAERDRHSRVQSLRPRTARTPPELL